MHPLLLLSLLTGGAASASGAIAGTVRADPTRTPVPYATVEIVELERRTLSDADGYYVFAGVPAGTWTLRAEALGYLADEQAVEVGESAAARADFQLPTDPVNVQGIRVQVQRAEAVGPPPVRIDLATIKRTPTYGEPDILRTAQMVPAAQAVSDFSSALYLRGGAPDQTLITLDGIPLFNPYHSGGLLSAFNPEAVESVEVMPGGFGAAVGDRLSGAVAIRTRDAERDRYHLEGGLGLLSLRSTVAGPLPGDGGLVVSLRRSFAPLSSAIYAKGMIPKDLPHTFGDVLVRASREVGRGAVTVTAYTDTEEIGALDSFAHLVDYDWEWGSRVAGLRFTYPVTATIRTELRTGISTFGTRLGSAWQDGLEATQTLDAEGRMRDAIVAGEAAWHGRFQTLRVGAQLDDYGFDYDVERSDLVGSGTAEAYIPAFAREEGLTTVAAWIEEELRLHPAVTARAGVRLLDAGALGRAWLPRFGGRIELPASLALTAAVARHAQAIHSLRATEAALSALVAYEVYGVAPAALGLATSDEVTAGLTWYRGNTSVQVDGYLRDIGSLPLPPLPDDPLTGAVVVPDGHEEGEATARGVEVLLRHVRGEGGAWLSYAYQSVEQTQAGLAYEPRYVRRHLGDAMVMVPIGRRWTVSARLLAGSGQPYTPTIGALPPSLLDPTSGQLADRANLVGILGDHNSATLRPYFRADLGVRHRIDARLFGRDVVFRPYLHLLNATLSDNELNRGRSSGLVPPCTFQEQYAAPFFGAQGVLSCTQQNVTQLPPILSLGVEWEY